MRIFNFQALDQGYAQLVTTKKLQISENHHWYTFRIDILENALPRH